MHPWDAADLIAAYFEHSPESVASTTRDELTRLHKAIADPALPTAAREQLIGDAARRIDARGANAVDRPTYDRLTSVLAARIAGDLGRMRPQITDAVEQLEGCDRYLEVASGWAEGCEIEMRLLERAVLQATVGLAEPELVAVVAVVTANIEHGAMSAQVAAYARACTPRTQVVAHDLGHRNEVVYLALRVVELASLSVGTSQLA